MRVKKLSVESPCEVVEAQFRWGVQTCGQMTPWLDVSELDIPGGESHAVCMEHIIQSRGSDQPDGPPQPGSKFHQSTLMNNLAKQASKNRS